MLPAIQPADRIPDTVHRIAPALPAVCRLQVTLLGCLQDETTQVQQSAEDIGEPLSVLIFYFSRFFIR